MAAAKKEPKVECPNCIPASLRKDFEEIAAELRDQPPEMRTAVGAGGGGFVRRLVENMILNRLRARAKKANKDFDEDVARGQVGGILDQIGEGRLWEWLVNGGLEDLIDLVVKILGLF